MLLSAVAPLPAGRFLGVAALLLGFGAVASFATAPSPGRRRAPQWVNSVALAFVMLSLMALVAVPWFGMREMQAMQNELARVASPSRELVTRLQLSLALQGAALLDYGETGDRAPLERVKRAKQEQRDGIEQLRPLATRLTPEIRARFDTLSVRQLRWQREVDAIAVSGDLPAGIRTPRTVAQQRAYEEVLVAIAQLDEALASTTEERWRQVSTARRQESWLAAILGGTALAAALVVGWLGRRLHVVADEAERRRHEVERLMERKATFIRGLSHDLKNPLGAIDGHAELLETGIRGELSEEQRASVRRIRGLVRALLALVEDVLEIARAEVGQLPIIRAPTDVSHLIHESVEAHRAAAVGAGLRLDLDLIPPLPLLSTDAHRVRQVLGNLLSNAVKYTPSGGHVVVHPAMRRKHRGEPHPCLAIDVRDTGPGIPKEQQEYIFEEFTRLDTGASEGAGVGLAIARQIARLLGEDITLVSDPGQGSTFTFWLPLATAGASAITAASTVRTSP